MAEDRTIPECSLFKNINRFGFLNFGHCYLPFDLAQGGGELVEPFAICDLLFEIFPNQLPHPNFPPGRRSRPYGPEAEFLKLDTFELRHSLLCFHPCGFISHITAHLY
jgi:hypothetical protein